jgi:signal transduction histidine kinase
MSNKSIKTLLLVEDNPGDARLLREMLNEQGSNYAQLMHVESMEAAENYLSKHAVDIILLDLGLPDAQGLEVVRRAYASAPHIPLVVLTGLDDESLALQTLQEGAQDYLIKDQIETRGLMRALHYAVERKIMESEIEHARDLALESVRLKSEFLANMKQEIYTPLNSVIATAGLLLNTELNAQQRRYVDTICVDTEDLLTIINDILDFSKIEAGKLNFENIDFDLHRMLEETIDFLEPLAQAKTIKIVSLVDTNVPPQLRGDPGRVRQLINYLLSNALKFTERGEVFIQVNLESETPTHVVMRFAISDTGIGIGEAEKRQLFQAFTQAGSASARKPGGMGLGLAISKQLVELMDGKIGVESTLEEGSTFWFTLKLEKQFGKPPSKSPDAG